MKRKFSDIQSIMYIQQGLLSSTLHFCVYVIQCPWCLLSQLQLTTRSSDEFNFI